MYMNNKELTSIEGFLQSIASLPATDSDDEDSVLCPGFQTEDCAFFAAAGYILGSSINFNLI